MSYLNSLFKKVNDAIAKVEVVLIAVFMAMLVLISGRIIQLILSVL